jgi:hypothetical protein
VWVDERVRVNKQPGSAFALDCQLMCSPVRADSRKDFNETVPQNRAASGSAADRAGDGELDVFKAMLITVCFTTHAYTQLQLCCSLLQPFRPGGSSSLVARSHKLVEIVLERPEPFCG